MPELSRPLIVRLRNWVGDVVLGLPALELIESQGYELWLIGKPWAESLLSGKAWVVHRLPSTLRERVTQMKELAQRARRRDAGFDSRANALICPFSFSSALDARLAGLRAVGYRYEARGFLLHRAVPLHRGGHEFERYWHLACAFLGQAHALPPRIRLPVSEVARRSALARLQQAGIRPPYWVLCPFAGGPLAGKSRHWPGFAELAQVLRQRGLSLLLCPGPNEVAQALRDFHGLTVLPEVDLATYAALIEGAERMVSNDTGPGHIAAAVGTPLVSILGPTPPQQWRAWGGDVTVVHEPAGWPTLRQVLDVLDAATDRARLSGVAG